MFTSSTLGRTILQFPTGKRQCSTPGCTSLYDPSCLLIGLQRETLIQNFHDADVF